MNGTEQHDFNSLLHAYLDGELDGAQEKDLFDALANDGNLRAELKDLQMLRSEAQIYYSGLGPSAALTGRVFSDLGIGRNTTPAGTGGNTAGPAAAGAAAKKTWLPLTATVITAAVTTIVLFTLLNTGPDSALVDTTAQQETAAEQLPGKIVPPSQSETGGNGAQSAAVQSGPAAASGNTSGGGTLGARGQDGATAPGADGVGSRGQSSPFLTGKPAAAGPAGVPQKGAGTIAQANEASTPGSGVMEEERVVFNRAAPIAAVRPGHPGPGAEGDSVRMLGWSPRNPHSGTPGPFSLRVQRHFIAGTGFPESSVNPTPDAPMFNDIGIALYYSLNEHHAFGIEAGLETYAQRYEGTVDGMRQRVEQRYRTPWLAGRYLLSFDAVSGSIALYPYLTAGAGATQEWWPLARLGGGLRYRLVSNLYLQAGIEGSMLFYPYDGAWFTSQNIGGTAGITVGF